MKEMKRWERVKSWIRWGEWFRFSHRPLALAAALGGRSPLVSSAVGASLRTADAQSSQQPSNGFTLDRRSGHKSARKQHELSRLGNGHTTLFELVESINARFEQQDRRSERVAALLDKLAADLSGLPGASRGQVEMLAGVRETVEQLSARARRCEESVAQLPQLADAQREAMAGIGRQLETTRLTSDRVAAAIDEFRRAVAGLGEATGASTAAIRQMHVAADSREDRMVTMLEKQNRRFILVSCLMLAVALVVAGMASLPAWLR